MDMDGACNMTYGYDLTFFWVKNPGIFHKNWGGNDVIFMIAWDMLEVELSRGRAIWQGRQLNSEMSKRFFLLL